jgi:hypothetical protein
MHYATCLCLYVLIFGFDISDGRIPPEQEKFSQDSQSLCSGSSDTESLTCKILGKQTIDFSLSLKTDAFYSSKAQLQEEKNLAVVLLLLVHNDCTLWSRLPDNKTLRPDSLTSETRHLAKTAG